MFTSLRMEYDMFDINRLTIENEQAKKMVNYTVLKKKKNELMIGQWMSQ